MIFGVCCSLFAASAELLVERSENLRDWEELPVTPEMLTEEGWILAEAATDSAFYRLRIRMGSDTPEGMVLVEAGDEAFDTFLIGKHEVTWGEWKEVREWSVDRGYDLDGAGNGCGDSHPVHSVTWYDVVKWCNARSEMEGLEAVYFVGEEVYRSGHHVPVWDDTANGYRLPTVNEWRFAASGGIRSEGYTFSGSNVLDEVAWYFDNADGAECNMAAGRGTWPVGLKLPNELGIYDMAGNVSEWLWNRHLDRFANLGGAFNSGASSGALTLAGQPGYRLWGGSNNLGLRVVRSRP